MAKPPLRNIHEAQRTAYGVGVTMNRRQLLTQGSATAAIGTAALALPATLAAQVRTGLPRDAQLAQIAKRAQQRAGNLLWKRDIVGIADYGLRSSEARFHFVNLDQGRVDSFRVTHGDGSDPEHDGWLNWFSNTHGSHCSSKGTYVTYGWYTGRFGTSIRLEGLDPTNNNALDRAIVMHRARYAEPSHLERWGRLGRSNGCFAMSTADFKIALLQLGGGRALFADSLGLQPDGTRIARPLQTAPVDARRAVPDTRLLQPDQPRGQDILNPGVF